MKIWLSYCVGLLLILPHTGQAAENEMLAREEAKVTKTLDGFHEAASKANFEAYFSYFAPEAVFIGTDASERWSVPVFKSYTAPHFAKGQGWTYKARERHVSFNAAKNPNVSWFDELLDSASYGTARGSGVLLKIGKDWKIAQYNLGFPIPNDLAKGMTETIKAFESQTKK